MLTKTTHIQHLSSSGHLPSLSQLKSMPLAKSQAATIPKKEMSHKLLYKTYNGFFSGCNECWKGNVLLVPTILASYSPKIWIRYRAKKIFKARQILAAFNKEPERHQLQGSWGLQYDHCFVRQESCLNMWQFCVSWVMRKLESSGRGNEGKDRAGCLASEALTRMLNLLSQGLSQANVTTG